MFSKEQKVALVLLSALLFSTISIIVMYPLYSIISLVVLCKFL